MKRSLIVAGIALCISGRESEKTPDAVAQPFIGQWVLDSGVPASDHQLNLAALSGRTHLDCRERQWCNLSFGGSVPSHGWSVREFDDHIRLILATYPQSAGHSQLASCHNRRCQMLCPQNHRPFSQPIRQPISHSHWT